MKSRRPNKFSDSVITKKGKLNRAIFEQYLSTLGNRNQERDFEEFCRKLCQLEICPNLRPQTGSVGGGDRKVDSETLPVTSQLRLSYYQGTDNQTNELWGFAFSTQKDWQSKVRADIKKAYETNKNYKTIIFITSQFARDKTSSALEQELSKQYGLRVIIQDRSWILDKVFGNGREKLAIEELKMGDGLEEEKEVGPLDLQRQKRIIKIEEKIESAVSTGNITLQIINSSIDCAILAARLEKPRVEVDGLFDRAIRLAEQYGNEEHIFLALYQKTWTTFFWFEDYKKFLDLYSDVEKLALASKNIYCLERLHNLWTLLNAISTKLDYITSEFVEEKKKALVEKLEMQIVDDSKPSAAVQAEAMLCFIKLVSDPKLEQKNTPEVFKQLRDVLERADNLIGFPFESITQVLNEMSDFFSGNSDYEILLERIVEIETKRKGEIPAGELLMQRGMQHLEAGRIYKAVDCLGRALIRFYKKESKDNLVRALFFLSFAYREAGLLWATRGALLNAASYATSDFWTYNDINTMQIACYKELKMIELQLGRVGYVLEWHILHLTMASQLAETEEEKTKLLDESIYFGSLLGLLLIKTPDKELMQLEKLPESLLKMDLDFAGYGLIYRLGGSELLPETFLKDMPPEKVGPFFNSWLTQPAQEDLPESPEYYTQESVKLRSIILGCEFIVETKNSSPELEVGEYILASLESFLSTSMELKAASRDSVVIIKILHDESVPQSHIQYEVGTKEKFCLIVRCGAFNPHSLSIEEQKNIASQISEIVLHLIANTIIFHDPKSDLQILFKNEEANNRAFSFSGPLVTLGNVLGYKPKKSIKDWINDAEKSYPYSPEKSGRPILDKKINDEKREQTPKKSEAMRHTDIRNTSIIRQGLWDAAGWRGVLYLTTASAPPIMAFLFTNKEKAEAIFDDWKSVLGNQDENDVIRISMIKGISEKNPAWYRALVGTNIDQTNPPKGRLIMVSRLHTLTPNSTENLDIFFESYKKFGIYLLAPAIFVGDKTDPEILIKKGIVKKAVVIRNALDIGENDQDVIGLDPQEKHQ